MRCFVPLGRIILNRNSLGLMVLKGGDAWGFGWFFLWGFFKITFH